MLALRFRPLLRALDERVVPAGLVAEFELDDLPTYAETASPIAGADTVADAPVEVEQPPAAKPPAFAKIDDVTDAYKKNKAAADLLAEFEKAGGTVVSGDTNTGAYIELGEKPKIVLDPSKLEDNSDAVGALLYELIRWKNQKQQTDIFDKVKAGTMTPEEGAVAAEKLTYEYMTEQQKILQAAVKAGDWKIATDRIGNLVNQFKTFDDFLKWMKESGHYGRMEAQLKAMAPKK